VINTSLFNLRKTHLQWRLEEKICSTWKQAHWIDAQQ